MEPLYSTLDIALSLSLALLSGGPVTPETPATLSTRTAQPTAPKRLTLSGSLRVREEFWDWFKPADSVGDFDNNYAFTGGTLRYGANYDTGNGDVRLELQAPFLFGLPKRAIAPAPQGGLGLGANYWAFNGAQNGSLFIKQAFYRHRNVTRKGSFVRAGRFEFSDGMETTPTDANLAWVKRQRISERLIGPFAWTHVGRSFDGLHYNTEFNGANINALAAYPTRGVFDLDGQDTITAVRFLYLSATLAGNWMKKEAGDSRPLIAAGDARFFAIGYEDARNGVNKVDNRPSATANADKDPIRLWTLGGHYALVKDSGPGKWDALLWAAYQFGDWGALDHKAYSYAVEGGYQFAQTPWKPWLRVGYNVGSGDGNRTDGDHGTFYPLLNTPRIYARTPFFGESNIRDLFLMAMVRPTPRTSIRADYHRLWLDKTNDQWYAAGGPFESVGNFGLVGRPNLTNSRNLADLFDISIDQTIDNRTSATLYFGAMQGKNVIGGIYPDKSGVFGYGEVTYKF